MSLDLIIPPVFTAVSIIIPAVLLHKREMKKTRDILLTQELEIKKQKQKVVVAYKKVDFLPRLMVLRNTAHITSAVKEILVNTRATRFLVYIGVNGKYELNTISCAWYMSQYDDDDIDPIKKYASLEIEQDDHYKGMLKRIATYQHLYEKINTMEMPKGVLKDIYVEEQVQHALYGFLNREQIDQENDFLTFFAFETDEFNTFTEEEESLIRRTVNAQIKTHITSILKNYE